MLHAPVVSEAWWLDTSALPDLLWARLRVLDDGSAEVFDLDGRSSTFGALREAELFLLEDEYERLDQIDPADLAPLNPESVFPPTATDDRDLLPLMLVRVEPVIRIVFSFEALP